MRQDKTHDVPSTRPLPSSLSRSPCTSFYIVSLESKSYLSKTSPAGGWNELSPIDSLHDIKNNTQNIMPDDAFFTQLPILPLAAALDPATKPQFLADLRAALLNVGFLYLSETGLPAPLVAAVKEECVRFFDELPREEKERIEMKNEKSFLGWSRVSLIFSWFSSSSLLLSRRRKRHRQGSRVHHGPRHSSMVHSTVIHELY